MFVAGLCWRRHLRDGFSVGHHAHAAFRAGWDAEIREAFLLENAFFLALGRLVLVGCPGLATHAAGMCWRGLRWSWHLRGGFGVGHHAHAVVWFVWLPKSTRGVGAVRRLCILVSIL